MDKTGLEDYQTKLLDLRNQLNTLDERLISLLISRFSITNEIGKLKQSNNQPIYDQMREATIYHKISEFIRGNQQSNNPTSNHTSNHTSDYHSNTDADVEMLVTCISEIYREIMNQSKISQSKIAK